jgi:hypothetical protein
MVDLLADGFLARGVETARARPDDWRCNGRREVGETNRRASKEAATEIPEGGGEQPHEHESPSSFNGRQSRQDPIDFDLKRLVDLGRQAELRMSQGRNFSRLSADRAKPRRHAGQMIAIEFVDDARARRAAVDGLVTRPPSKGHCNAGSVSGTRLTVPVSQSARFHLYPHRARRPAADVPITRGRCASKKCATRWRIPSAFVNPPGNLNNR